MKALFVLALALVSANAFAFKIVDARYNAATESIDVDLRYGGGCEEHKFKLETFNGCLESYPVQCRARVVDISAKPDFCEALIHSTVSFKLTDYGLDDGYYNGASFAIYGTGDKAEAHVRLPFKQ